MGKNTANSLTALIAEDEALIAEELAQRLEEFGIRVIATVDSGHDAVRVACAEVPHLVLMDVRLRGEMDGISAAREIRSRIDVPVIYVTAYADHVTLDRAKNTAPYGYVLKPFRTRELEIAIELALHRHELEKQARQRNPPS